MERINQDNTIQSCILRIRAVQEHLNPAERRVADYILNHPQDVLTSTINELAAKANTSYATVTRLISKIGYEGIKELKKDLYADSFQGKILDTLDVMTFSQNASIEEICRQTYTLMNSILSDSYDLVLPEMIDAASSMIIAADRLCIFGTGLSGSMANYANIYLLRIGINCIHEDDPTNYKIRASLLTPKDVVLAISSSGRSANTLEAVRIAHESGAKIIALSDFSISPLSQLADINLYTTPRNAGQFLDIDMPLSYGQLYIINVLYMACCVKLGKHASDLFQKTRRVTDREKLSN